LETYLTKYFKVEVDLKINGQNLIINLENNVRFIRFTQNRIAHINMSAELKDVITKEPVLSRELQNDLNLISESMKIDSYDESQSYRQNITVVCLTSFEVESIITATILTVQQNKQDKIVLNEG
jgi:hypothetical protein